MSATTDQATYSAGETVTVSVTGGYRPGWVRAKLWDKDCSSVGCLSDDAVAVASNTCASCLAGVGGVDGETHVFPGPVVLTFPAPATSGTYTWSASWYGNVFDLDQIGDTTTFGPLWLLDPGNGGHGDEIVTFSFEVVGASNVPPVAVDDSASTAVNTAVDIDVLFNDTDADEGDVLTVNSFDAASSGGGTVSCSLSATTPTPQCTFIPATNVCGADSFTYDATDGIDTSNRATVTIQIGDANAPVVTAPADLTITLPAGSTDPVPATDPEIEAWLGSATAVDPEEGNLPVDNNAPASFPIGTTPVTFTAADSCGNEGAAAANVIILVADNNVPVVTAPAPLTVTAPLCADSVPRSDAEIQTWLNSATANDVEDGALPVNNNAPMDFLLGDTLVTFSAEDSVGAIGTADSTLTVNETPNTAPVVSAPAPITITVPQGTISVPATDPAIAAFLADASANDAEDGQLAVSDDAPADFPLGTTTVTFSATDSCGATGSNTSTVTIEEEAANEAPTADPNGPYSAQFGDPITFDGSGSYDPDGNIVAYDWDFGDGDTGTGVNPTHTYGTPGTFTVTLTVRDDGAPALSDSAITTVTITDVQPPDDDKVTICHKGKQTITVAEPAVEAHLRHGDTLGPCTDDDDDDGNGDGDSDSSDTEPASAPVLSNNAGNTDAQLGGGGATSLSFLWLLGFAAIAARRRSMSLRHIEGGRGIL